MKSMLAVLELDFVRIVHRALRFFFHAVGHNLFCHLENLLGVAWSVHAGRDKGGLPIELEATDSPAGRPCTVCAYAKSLGDYFSCFRFVVGGTYGRILASFAALDK